MGFSFCTCNKDNQNIPMSYTNLSLLDKNHNNHKNFNPNINSSDLNQRLNNISEASKNININIININKEPINSKKYSSNYNSSCINNNETNKLIDPLNYRKQDVVKEESDAKECDEEEEEEEEENIQIPDPKLEEIKANVIKNFDNKISEFAEYLTDSKFEEMEKSFMNKHEENLEKFQIKINIWNVSHAQHFYLKRINRYIKVLGIFKGKKKVLEFFLIQKGINILENGKKINLMEKED